MLEPIIDGVQPNTTPSIIKVIGVGGGGSNAVNKMYREGIHNVNFVVCNTDSKALADSPVPRRLQLGKEGLGAGNQPERGRAIAEDSVEDIRSMLDDGTRMVFITAGMGGGTGTGAAPVIAREAKAMGILTVGIVTIPFIFEGQRKIDTALDGVEEMAKNVDALLIISNEALRAVFPDLTVMKAFGIADNTLSVSTKSIADIISMHGIINLDFRDVCNVLKNGGIAVMSTGYGEGDNRVSKAFEQALHSPLLHKADIFRSTKMLFSISFCDDDENSSLMMEEMSEVHEFMSRFGDDVEIKWGLSVDKTLERKVKVTLLAAGFDLTIVPDMQEKYEAELSARSQRDEEKAYEDAIRREKYYGSMNNGTLQRPKPKVFIFQPQDLDNEEIISMVELSPTYKRTKETLEQIRRQRPQEPARQAENTLHDTLI